jgi:DNA-binding transcriptional LysR family regulator
MHVKSLKVFCDIVGRRSFSRAADDNQISQSRASHMVQQLEERLGIKLIDRSKRPFVLTPEGQVYYDGCRKLVQRYYALEEEVRTLHQEVAGRVRVASIYSAGLSHLNRYVQEFLSQHPKANVRLQYQHPQRVYELVEADQVDLGLVSFPKSSRTIKAMSWRIEPMVLVCAPGHPLARRDAVVLQDLHNMTVVGFDPELQIRREIDRLLAAEQIEVNVVMEFDNIETIKGAVKINAGVSLLPEPTVEAEVSSGSLIALPVNGVNLHRPLGIIHRRGKQLGKTARRFLQLLQDKAHEKSEPADKASAPAASGALALSHGHSKKYAATNGSANGSDRASEPNRSPALTVKT